MVRDPHARDPDAREVLVTRRRALYVLAVAVVLSARVAFLAPASPPPPVVGSVLIEGVPHVRQKPDFCGEACAAMFLAKLGKKVDQDAVFDASGVDPAEGRGCHTRDLRKALLRLGFRTGEVWHEIDAPAVERVFSELRRDLGRGIPSIVLMRYDATPGASEHFRLVLGFDVEKDEVIYHEPAETAGAYRRMPRERFLDLWAFPYPAGRLTLVRLRLEPGRMVDAAGNRANTSGIAAGPSIRLARSPANTGRISLPALAIAAMSAAGSSSSRVMCPR